MDEEPLYAGLSGLEVGDMPIDFGHGITLSKTYAHVMSSVMLAFAKPSAPNQPHPGPWTATASGFGYDVDAQLAIPSSYTRVHMDRFQVAKSLVCLLRLWADPEITFPVVAKYPFAELPTRPTSREQVAFAIEIHPRGFGLRLADKTNVINSLGWVVTNWESALDLMETSAEFKLAMEVFEVGQFNRSTAMTLVSLWGALEAIFSANTSELRFRVSSMIASYLYAAGQQRLETQQQIAKLYDLRSAAAHGRPKHDGNQVLQTFELFRKVLIKIIVNKRVPTRADLDNMLLGGVVG